LDARDHDRRRAPDIIVYDGIYWDFPLSAGAVAVLGDFRSAALAVVAIGLLVATADLLDHGRADVRYAHAGPLHVGAPTHAGGRFALKAGVASNTHDAAAGLADAGRGRAGREEDAGERDAQCRDGMPNQSKCHESLPGRSRRRDGR
jgi:hypothetical protein